MTDEQAEMAATEIPEVPPDLPPSPAEHMPPTPDPMQVIEPLLGVLQELAQVSSRVADCARDVKWQLGGLVLTAHEMAPLTAPDATAEVDSDDEEEA